MATESELRNALGQVKDPELGQSIVDLGMVRDLQVTDGKVAFTLALTNLSCPFKDRMVNGAKQAVQALDEINGADTCLAEMTAKKKAAFTKEYAPESMAEKLNDVKHVIAIMSGRSEVGRSLVTDLLASNLHRMGHKVSK
jgi:ATP-binding protein involved in chromosome partitioning